MKTATITIEAQVQVYRPSEHHGLFSAHLLSADGKTTYNTIQDLPAASEDEAIEIASEKFGAATNAADAADETEDAE